MTWHRHRISGNTLLMAAAITVCLLLLAVFYFSQRAALANQRDDKFHAVNDAVNLLQQQNELKQFTAKMGKSVTSDSAAAEGQLLHILHDWEQRAGVMDSSFQRIGMSQQNGFVLMTFDVSAAGNTASVAGFLYLFETAAIPLRVENVQIRSRSGSDDNLQINLQISTLFRGHTHPRQNTQDSDQLAKDQLSGGPG